MITVSKAEKVRLPSPEVSPHSCEPRGELLYAHECDRFRASGVHHEGEMPDHYNFNQIGAIKSRYEDKENSALATEIAYFR
jgi:hypothetical protein